MYLVEAYAPRTSGAEVKAAAERASAAAAAVTAAGRRVRHVRSMFLRADETCFHLFEADAAEPVAEVVERAGIECERIVEADFMR